MSVKRKLMRTMDWFLLGRAGEVFLILALLVFCLMVTATVLLIGSGVDKAGGQELQIERIYYSGIWI